MKNNIRSLLCIAFCGLLFSALAHANDIEAASCSQSDVQKAIGLASNGDRVLVPAGTCNYTTVTSLTPSVSINKAITVKGQTVCTGRAATLVCTDKTIINDHTGTAFHEDPFELAASGARLTGITIVDSRGLTDDDAYILADKDTTGWRVDHCHISSNIGGTGQGEGVEANGYGLIDHVYVQNADTAFPAYGRSKLDTKYPGDNSWALPMSFGTANAVYVEDSELNYTAAVLNGQDDYAGARIVFRFNDVQGTNIGSHGLDSGGLRSTMQFEIYNNTFENAGSHIGQWFVSRGGSFLIFDNTISPTGGSFDTFLDLRVYRSNCGSVGGECGVWGNCDGTSAGQSGTAGDQNTANLQGYICRDQIGRGTELNPSNDWPVKTTGYSFSEESDPGYSWGNSWKGGSPTISNINICGYITTDCSRARTFDVINNRDFYMEAALFNGTNGTGTGTLANRPSTCVTGVVYWATDQGSWNSSGSGGQGQLYKCTSTNTWTLFYTPYFYPHPLQGPPSPTLGATVH